MIFFLAVILIGTLYPVFLDTLIGEKISIGPPYYNFVLAPFLIPLDSPAFRGPTTVMRHRSHILNSRNRKANALQRS